MVDRVASTLDMERPTISPLDEVIAGGFTIADEPPRSRGLIRIVSWNIECGLQFPTILGFLRAAQADLILLQEVDLNARRTEFRDVASDLARSLRLNCVFGKQFQELGQELRAGSEAASAYHGLATLSPWPLSNGRVIRFQHQSNFWKPRWWVPRIELFQRRVGGRIALVAEARVASQSIVTYNLHLESKGNDELRVRQLRETLEDTRRRAESSLVVVGGDFNLNASEGEAAATLRSAGFRDALGQPQATTTAQRIPLERGRSIDWIYVSDDVRSEGKIHNRIQASDHYPISVRFALS
jgi:endonuclease/exonuclease/phosphatase family metal-dependent hydrolase